MGSTCGVRPAIAIFFKEISDVHLTGDDWQKAKTQTEVSLPRSFFKRLLETFGLVLGLPV